MFESINSFLSGQPWWLLAIGGFIAAKLLGKNVRVSADISKKPSRGFKEQLRATIQPFALENSNSHTVKISTQKVPFAQATETEIQSSGLLFEGEDAQELLTLLTRGDKIGAIKYVREKKNMELTEAKNLVDAMSKLAL